MFLLASAEVIRANASGGSKRSASARVRAERQGEFARRALGRLLLFCPPLHAHESSSHPRRGDSPPRLARSVTMPRAPPTRRSPMLWHKKRNSSRFVNRESPALSSAPRRKRRGPERPSFTSDVGARARVATTPAVRFFPLASPSPPPLGALGSYCGARAPSPCDTAPRDHHPQ